MKNLMIRARRALEHNVTPPQRYGTAFHINLPFSDIRSLPAATSLDQTEWEKVSAENQDKILQLDVSDVYLAWQLIHNQGRCIALNAQETQTIHLTGAGLYFIFLEPGATLNIEDEIINEDVVIRRLFVWQAAGSQLSFTGLRTQTNFLNEKLQVELLGPAAKTAITHLIYGQDQEQYDVAVSAFHRTPQTTSRLLNRPAGLGKSKTIYRGLIDVDQAATGTNGYQSSRALLLSRQAVVDQLPRLEIRTNDVRCSHGVTATHLDDQALFYMRSRGLPEKEARKIAVRGFFHHQLDLPSKIRKSLEHVLA